MSKPSEKDAAMLEQLSRFMPHYQAAVALADAARRAGFAIALVTNAESFTLTVKPNPASKD